METTKNKKEEVEPTLLNRILSNDIVFYGQVLDLDGNPVPHAKINYACLNSGNFDNVWTGGGTKDKIMHTDESGRFEIHDVGGSLYVNCTHSDYYGNNDPKEGSKRKFGYGFQVGDAPARNPKNPAIFRLRKKGICEPLYFSDGWAIHRGQDWIRIPNEPYAINLLNGRAEDANTSVYISYVSDRVKGQKQNYNWEYTLRIPGGGFVEKQEDFDFVAPESGYKEEVRFGDLKGGKDWRRRKRCFYFVKFPNGLHGIFEIDARASGSIVFQSLVNPNPFSRNLEYEYKMQINRNQQGVGCYGRL